MFVVIVVVVLVFVFSSGSILCVITPFFSCAIINSAPSTRRSIDHNDQTASGNIKSNRGLIRAGLGVLCVELCLSPSLSNDASTGPRDSLVVLCCINQQQQAVGTKLNHMIDIKVFILARSRVRTTSYVVHRVVNTTWYMHTSKKNCHLSSSIMQLRAWPIMSLSRSSPPCNYENISLPFIYLLPCVLLKVEPPHTLFALHTYI